MLCTYTPHHTKKMFSLNHQSNQNTRHVPFHPHLTRGTSNPYISGMGILKNSTMEATISHQFKIRFLRPESPSSPPIRNQQSIPRNVQLVPRMRCAKSGSVPELDKKLEEELVGMKKLNENCKEIGGIVELVECLEREAIMGEDKGRDASDYHRRAHIFYESSRVFQALKERRSSFD